MVENHSSPKETKTESTALSPKVSPWLARLLYPLGSYMVMPLYFSRLEVTGQENIPRTGPVIVAPTHRSRWDALVVPYAVGRLASGRDLYFMVSANETTGIQGWFVRRMGGFPVDPEHPAVSSLRHSIELLREDKMLVIFPEGNIYRDGQLHPLKRGIARIALEVEAEQPGRGMKILPVSIRYSQKFPSWRCNVKVDIGVPLEAAEYRSDSTRQSSQRLTADLESALQNLHQEKSQDSTPVAA